MSTAKLGIDVTGGRAGVAQLEDLKRGLHEVGAEAERVSVKLRAAKKAWEDPLNAKEWSRSQKLAAEGVKLVAGIVSSQAGALASAVTGPAKTSYDQALNRAYRFRDENTKIALSVGKSYQETNAQIFGTSKQLGLMPGQVSNYGRSVRQLTGDWHGAMSGIEGYQNRALKTDRTIEEMIPTAATLAQTFGIKSTEDVNRFFGTLDVQSKRAKVSAEVAERAFLSASNMLSATTGAKASTVSALTTGFLAKAPTAALGEQAMGEVMGLLTGHSRVIGGRMVRAGKLGKNESLLDKTGRFREDKIFEALQFVQKDIMKVYGAKSPAEAIESLVATGELSGPAAAALFNLDVPGMQKAATTTATAEDIGKIYRESKAGKREISTAVKEQRDIAFGEKFLGLQDKAVEMGGGAAGVAIGSASQIFSQGAQTFWNAVDIFAKSAGARAVGAATGAAASGAAGAAAGTAAGTAATATAAGVASKVIGAVGVPGIAAGVLTMSGDKDRIAPWTADEVTAEKKKFLASQEEHLATVRKGGVGGWFAETFMGGGEKETEARINELKAELGMGGDPQQQAQATAGAISKMYDSKILKVQVVPMSVAPPGQSQSL